MTRQRFGSMPLKRGSPLVNASGYDGHGGAFCSDGSGAAMGTLPTAC
jgi:hypothetical protein